MNPILGIVVTQNKSNTSTTAEKAMNEMNESLNEPD